MNVDQILESQGEEYLLKMKDAIQKRNMLLADHIVQFIDLLDENPEMAVKVKKVLEDSAAIGLVVFEKDPALVLETLELQAEGEWKLSIHHSSAALKELGLLEQAQTIEDRLFTLISEYDENLALRMKNIMVMG